MGMNQVGENMRRLLEGLSEFNDSLRQSMNDLNNRHEEVQALWQDSMRQEYDTRWLPMREKMDQYIQHTGPIYLETIQRKLTNTTIYLNGNQH